ncbi:DoxX family protein [Sphingomonas sp. SUN039]|uniref:DoxX family protein n=1 Tax=Sphingomonas sp. SUN039 TaxID=2937787 RepID=UPI0021641B65|nr:DoxX family protein [Sphingomonas sp. SUN039]UVO53094.1 DoxX family protein [Sphingomonas sp. SUN039]
MVRTLLCAVLALPLAAFFAFVGWHKAFSPLAELVKHGAYTVHLPEWLGRIAGVTEMLCALALLAGIVPRWRVAAKWGAVYVFVSQIVAGTIHILYGETHSLPANGQRMAMAAALFAVCVWPVRKATAAGELA